MNKAVSALFVIVMLVALGKPGLAIEQPKSEADLGEANAGLMSAASSYRDARNSYITVRRELSGIKEREKAELLDKGKEFMLRTDEAAVRYLESLKRRVESTKGFPEEKRENMVAEIDACIAWLDDARADIRRAKSIDRLHAIARQMHKNWRQYRGVSKRTAGQVLNAKLDVILARSEETAVKMQGLADALKSKGKDTERLELLLDEFGKKLSLAREKNDAAKAQFNGITVSGESNVTFREGIKLTREAHKELKEAHSIILEMGKEVKELSAASYDAALENRK